ncbi:MAG: phosphoglycerate kinase [Deltaproteobacteria bacterium]|nr:phosphoglycerate kinase [Deltaproteobacteria bacterium]
MALSDRIATLESLDVASRRVFVRVDFDVPLEKGAVGDDTRIREALPTLRYLINAGARVVVATHLGAAASEGRKAMSLEPIALRLAELLGQDVVLTDEPSGDGARKVVHDLRDGRIAVLENLRADPGEELNDDVFARSLARLADAYVNESFTLAHKSTASLDALARLVPVRAAGLQFRKELDALGPITTSPQRPFFVVLGGTKLSEKRAAIEALIGRVDGIFLGGALTHTMLAAKGRTMGMSLLEEDKLPMARDVLARAHAAKTALFLPSDLRVRRTSAKTARGTKTDKEPDVTEVVSVDRVPSDAAGRDIGPATVEQYRHKLLGAGTILWLGPMGVGDKGEPAEGSIAMAHAIAEAAAHSIAVGKESCAAVRAAGVSARFKHSTASTAPVMALLEGRTLTAVEVLRT